MTSLVTASVVKFLVFVLLYVPVHAMYGWNMHEKPLTLNDLMKAFVQLEFKIESRIEQLELKVDGLEIIIQAHKQESDERFERIEEKIDELIMTNRINHTQLTKTSVAIHKAGQHLMQA